MIKKILISLFLISTLFISSKLYASTQQTPSELIEELSKMGVDTTKEYTDKHFLITTAQHESKEGNKLFFYVYNSTKYTDIVSVRMNINDRKNELININYKLQSRNFYKFEIILDNKLLNTESNQYGIVYLNAKNGNELKALNISKEYLFYKDESGKYEYQEKYFETIEIKDFFTGFNTYTTSSGSNPGLGVGTILSEDHQYIAFNPSYKIDDLYEAEVEYSTNSVSRTKAGLFGGWKTKKTYIGTQKETVNSTQNVELDRYGFRKAFVFDRISKVSELDKPVEEIKKYTYFLKFKEYERKTVKNQTVTTETFTEVFDTTIIRLKFELAGVVYNLNAVCDTKTPIQTDDPLNIALKPEDYIFFVIYILCVILIIFLIGLVSKLCGGIKKLLVSLYKAIEFIVLVPFKILKFFFVRKEVK